jgi:adenylate kinase family enzyme
MNKIIVIGCPGSGKTTFAEKLRDKTGLPLFYLDAIWHKPDKTHISREDFDKRMSEILPLDSWIIDGNYQRTIESRIIACDTVCLFDLPSEICLEGAISRLGKDRYDMPWIDTELDAGFRKEIEEFREKNLSGIYDLIRKHCQGKTVRGFRSREEADSFILEADKAR